MVVRDVFSRVMAGLQAWPPGLDHRRPFLTRTLARGVYLHLPIPVSEMRSGPPRYVPPSAHDWGQVLMFQGQTCSLFRSFTTKVRVADFIETKRELNDPCRNLYHRIKHLLFFPFSFFVCTKFDINIGTFTNMH